MFRPLLIPLDRSEFTERALEYGRNLATITAAEVTLRPVTEISNSGRNLSDPAVMRSARRQCRSTSPNKRSNCWGTGRRRCDASCYLTNSCE